jgi:GNAT superfamily N-acetyltransferase
MLRDELARVEAHARAIAGLHSDRATIGPFDIFYARDDGPSYAVPARLNDDQDALRADIAALVRAFAEREVPVRVELTLLLWPELPPALAASGLTQIEDSPLFIVTPGSFRPRPPGDLDIRWVGSGESPALALSLVRQGFELRGPPPTPEEVAALRASLDGPLRLATADQGGRPAGAGFSVPIGTTTELSGLTTLPLLRHKGIAARLGSFLVAEHFRSGGDLAWGVTEDPRAAALLYALGFQDAGLRVGWMRAGDD